MNIRKATLEDLKAITEVEALCFPNAEAAKEESFYKRLSVFPNYFWTLWDEDVMVGMVNGMVTDEADLTDEMYDNALLHNENGAWQMIFGVETIPSYRRQGCAEMILRQVIKDARAQGRKGLVLTCKERLIHYYAKFGFANEGMSESVHGGAVWYQMRLSFNQKKERELC